MALPALLRKLFKSSGYGSELNDGIISRIISNQDWSNSYDYPVGVVARGSDDKLYYSVAQSGPGTSAGAKDPAQGGNSGYWKSFGSGDSVPAGTVLWLSTTAVPAGYLLCNGAAVGRATYPELFAAIGTTYGVGDGSTTFNLPNLIDRFAEGSTVAGTVKNAGLPNITGDWKPSGLDTGSEGIGALVNLTQNSNGWMGHAQKSGQTPYLHLDASKSNAIYGNSYTVQPPALTLLPCIKAFASVVGDATVVAGQLVNEIQSKVALDGSNASAIGKNLATYMAHAAMPNVASEIAITLPYIAPADGYIMADLYANPSAKTTQIFSGSVRCTGVHWDGPSNTVGLNVIFPVSKGDRITANGSGFTSILFIYANGTTP